MKAASATPVYSPTADEARAELGKFFAIAAMADQAPGMFSQFIDAEWHQFAKSADYARFCDQTAGRLITHDPTCGEGEVAWLGLYHERFGALPASWFADENGTVDAEAYATYLDTHTVRASWNCSATTGDGGGFTESSK